MGDKNADSQRHAAPYGKTQGGTHGRLRRSGFLFMSDAQFIVRVSTEGVLCHELRRNLSRQGRFYPSIDVYFRKFIQFSRNVFAMLGALPVQFGALGIALGVNGNVFAGSH